VNNPFKVTIHSNLLQSWTVYNCIPLIQMLTKAVLSQTTKQTNTNGHT